MKSIPISVRIEASSRAVWRAVLRLATLQVVDPNSPLCWVLAMVLIGLAVLVAQVR